MSDEFELVRQGLVSDATATIHKIKELPHRRLLESTRAVGNFAPATADLAVLTRHVLRGEQERQNGISPTLVVPTRAPWPSASEWDRFGIEVVKQTQTHLHIQSRPWMPRWLPTADIYPIDGPAARGEQRREYGEFFNGDPFLDSFPEWQRYRCSGQQEAVRGILIAPPGSTFVVNLPTGVGKSLCAHLPALLDPTGLTVVVMPTTALALDQERVLSKRIAHQTAYHGGPGEETAARNRGIRERLKAGTQRILFASPESIVTRLAGALYAAAGRGILRMLAIDEAHMVDQWGDDFRSEFQELAGLRHDLLRQCPGPRFKTLLLSGTVTEGCLDTLETLFGLPGPFDMLSAVQLRPEPSYWSADCVNEDVRNERILETLRHLPRPLILYTTRVDDADRWRELLLAEGFKRSATVTGKTKPADRVKALNAWQSGHIDLMIATSAFGLGMDKGDVRAVVHACIPEHIDRYYQEVGRGGRDGCASVSVLLHTPDDHKLASDLNKKLIISPKKGFDRWKKMYHTGERLPDGRRRVPIHCVPEYGYGEFTESERNEAWNIHTLTLLARSGIIDLDAESPPQVNQFFVVEGQIDEEKFQAEFNRHRQQRVIRVLDDSRSLDFSATWLGQVEEVRVETARAATHGLELMDRVLKGTTCLSQIFAEAYEILVQSGFKFRPGAIVSRACGGCAACRRQQLKPSSGFMPIVRSAWSSEAVEVPTSLARLIGTSRQVFIFDDQFGRWDASQGQRRERLLRTLLASGIQSIVALPQQLEILRTLVRSSSPSHVFFNAEWRPLYLPRTPTLVYGPDPATLVPIVETSRAVESADLPHLIWLDSATPDPSKPHALLIHTTPSNSFRLEEFCTRIGI